MKVELVSAAAGLKARVLMVLIPGAHQGPQELQAAGFISAVRDRRLAIDMALVAPEPAHLTDRSVLSRLHTDLVQPARSSGPVEVWFAGISWGGFLALLYAADHPADLDGVCLLGPYLGTRLIITEICGFGSLAEWSAGTSAIEDELIEERRVWRFIASQVPHPALIRYLGFGREDRFAPAQRLLADQLPAQAVDVVDGGHDGTVWRRLWDRLLDRMAGTRAELVQCP
jgi:pimeloyl-ACP methyl ester carboxylesterase